VDVIITTSDFVGAELDPAIDLVPIAEDEIVLVLPPDHPFSAHESINLDICRGQRWTFDVPGSYMSELATRLCREAGFEPAVICRFNNYMIALQHVEKGRSIALLPSLAVDPRYRVTTRPLGPPVTRRITAAVRRPATPRPEITAVLSALRTGHPAESGGRRRAGQRSAG
jgi:DNA-binding transcriptional LysR family regulator